MSVVPAAIEGSYSLTPRVGQTGKERAKAHLVMALVMNALSRGVRGDIRWTAAAT